ncbi:methyltransferase family protein [Mannheimia granulomatis]|uniref:Protein-S-isoprenylcysteine methyltransferase n=2 Tax=Mannheimia granulomatis TaxID=85402 RepID=A0A011LVM9_9PAST|nr:isoprenylcysteine carboxylmethyltransferase family protein [Mannheimia granulomatis]EXI61263.1 protein-S-isoprenylcysteine methyltransferase [Mannheimia granulomatis]
MNSLKLKIPPPLWFLLCAAVMWLLAYCFPSRLPNYQHIMILILAALLVLSAGVIATLAISALHRAKTTYSPFKPENTNRLVNRGIYRKSRNPMYLALLLGLISWALLLGSLSAWSIVPLFMWLITYFQIKPEEQILLKKFGKGYSDYLMQVRRWF